MSQNIRSLPPRKYVEEFNVTLTVTNNGSLPLVEENTGFAYQSPAEAGLLKPKIIMIDP